MNSSVASKLTDEVLAWLLAGDPAIRWQVLRDLVGAPPRMVENEQQKVAHEGWGARLLDMQDSEGTWAGGLYSPKWMSTTYTMLLLRDFGLPPLNLQARRACRLLLDQGLQRDGGINYGWRGRSETCVTGMVLSILAYFQYDDERVDTIVDHLVDQQMPDGGWNCRRPYGATHASVHTTISVLEGLRMYELHRRRKVRNAAAASSSWCTGFSVLIVPVTSSSPSLFASPFRRAGTTTSCARSIISRPPTQPATSVSLKPLTSSGETNRRTAAGHFNTSTRGRPSSNWNASARPAAGTRSARFGC